MGRASVILESLPLSMLTDFAQKADEHGYDTVWKPEIIFSDTFVPSTAFALKTKRIHIGSCITGIWGRSPVVTALSASALAELSGNRLILGLGTQARSYVEGWHGLSYDKPLTRARELITVIKKILSGEVVTFEGKTVSVQHFQLALMGPPPKVPIYLAAIGPKMTQLAGEIADGVIGYFQPINYFRDTFLKNLEIGAKKAGRTLDDIDIVVGHPALVSDDPKAVEWIKPHVVMFATAGGSSPTYAGMVKSAGFEKNLEGMLAGIANGSMDEAASHVSDEMVDAMTLCGTAQHVADRMNDYYKAGVKMTLMNPVPPKAYFPLFAGHFPETMEFPQPDVEAFVQNVDNIVTKVPL